MRNHLFYAMFSLFLFGCSDSIDGELLLVEPGTDNDFEFPYYLFIPEGTPEDRDTFVIIEPNNSGFADDDIEKHMDKAGRTASRDFYLGNYLSKELKYPLVVPVFPRSRTHWQIYTHALDRDVMQQKDNELERIDKQLISMYIDAKSRLQNKNISTRDRFLLTGFSASGTFANRFTLLHPDKVYAVAAGGLNGLLMLPVDSLDHEALEYPIGVADLDEFRDEGFQEELFQKTPQFYFMGELDENDAIPYDDAFSEHEREQIYKILGENMMPDRWDKSREFYTRANINARFKTYNEIGHEQPEVIKKDILEFFKENIYKERGAKAFLKS
ncbi:alpha/beta hydrolase [Gramella sp. KN1008]|uniref:alpha/beta hydrolase n=1 Tax=Gramella sp. KN1008 TaxID=2529298 RepID=UPI00103BBDE6|nr:alpha/beta hydrolase [Gramella sp. KN1008]TBW29978.1 alpha/beta hydrolase [Gramella sp. KN1008]